MEYEIDTELWLEHIEIEHVDQSPHWRHEPPDRDPQRGIAIPDEEYV